jgi:hypothetical protein
MRSSRRLVSILCALGAILSREGRAHSEEPALPAPQATCPAPADASPALADVDAPTRLAFIRATLSDQAGRSRTWSWGWVITGTALVAGNFTMAAFASNPTDRSNDIVGGALSVLIPLPILLRPPSVLSDESELDAMTARSSQSCATLARAEELLRRGAGDQAQATGVGAHAIGIGLNVAVGLVLGLGFGDWKGAATVGGVGVVIAEGEILTRPRGAIDGLEHYRRGELTSSSASRAWYIAPLASPSAGGLDLVVAF